MHTDILDLLINNQLPYYQLKLFDVKYDNLHKKSNWKRYSS